MSCLPPHGRVACSRCFANGHVDFDATRREGDGWRITSNPLAWGSSEPEVIVLGFSKGPTQAGALASEPHDAIAYRGARRNVGKILRHVGLMPGVADWELEAHVERAIADRHGRFHFASLIRCTVERLDSSTGEWVGTGGSMLGGFVTAPLGYEVASNCASQHLAALPTRTRLIIMFGMGTKNAYTRATASLIQRVRGGSWRWLNEVTYYDPQITVVHVEHFRSQGALIPQWLGETPSPRSNLGQAAKAGVEFAMTRSRCGT